MTGNLVPWLILAGIVAATLVLKGYVKLPMPTRAGGPQATPTSQPTGPSSHELGVLFAQAKKREAEEELATLFAKQAGDALKASYTAPFSPPAPAGQDQAPPAGPPA